jgi:surfactin synthase thioesterase subunit
VFCFPYSGVGASMFNRWPRMVDDVEICPIQLPGRENRIREPHFGSFEQLADALVDYLQPWLDRPFSFFGHCAGALPAYETAVRLAEHGLPVPSRLVVSAQVAPHHCPHDRFLELTDHQLRDELGRFVAGRGGTPNSLLLDLTMTVLGEDLDAVRAYSYPAPVTLPSGITVVQWSHDVEVGVDELASWREYSDDVQFVEFDGGHFAFLDAPAALVAHVASVARQSGVISR